MARLLPLLHLRVPEGGDNLVHGGLPCRHWGPGLAPVSSAFFLTTSSCLWAPARTPGFNTRENPEKLKTLLPWGVWSFSLQTFPGCLDRICLSESLLGPGGSPLPPLPSDPHSPLLSSISLSVLRVFEHLPGCPFCSVPTEKRKVKSLSRVQVFVTPWTIAHQALLSMGFSRQEYWSGLPFPSPGDLPNPGIEPGSPALQADPLPSKPPGNSSIYWL